MQRPTLHQPIRKRRTAGALVTLGLTLLLLGGPQALAQGQLEALVGRLMLVAYPGSDVPLERLEELGPAGFLFYPSNVPSTETARHATRTLQQAAGYPLLFGIDQEGGPFTTYRVDDATLFPGNMALAATGDPELATAVARATGEELAYAGFNLNFAPVVDVNINPDNPIIGIRSFGTSVDAVTAFGRAYLEGLEQAGVAGVAKHFPGHGDTAVDTHLGLASVDGDRTRLQEVELPPFAGLIEAGVPAIMTAHVAFPAIEPDLPATLSRAALTELLREEMRFDGLVVTDYMDMKAIDDNFGAGEAAVLSVLAGADLLLLGPDLAKQREVHAALVEAVRSGRLSAERVEDAVARSSRLAERYRPDWDAPAPDYRAHRELARRVAAQAATLLWNDDVLPLAAGSNVLVVAPRPGLFGTPPHLGTVLERSHPGTRSITVAENPSEAEIERTVAEAQSAEVIVLGSYHWLGGFPGGMARLAQRLLATGKPVVVVALGNPDDLRFLDGRPAAYLAAYGYREANLQGAAAIITGASEPGGALPVPAGDFPLGAGMDGF